MALVLLSGGPGEKLVAEPLASAARVPYQTTSAMVPSEEPSQARDEGTKIDACWSLPGDRRAREGDLMLRLSLPFLVLIRLAEGYPGMQSTPELGSDGLHALAPWGMT